MYDFPLNYNSDIDAIEIDKQRNLNKQTHTPVLGEMYWFITEIKCLLRFIFFLQFNYS